MARRPVHRRRRSACPDPRAEQSPFAEPIRDYVHNLVVGNVGALSSAMWRYAVTENMVLLEVVTPPRSRRTGTPEGQMLGEWMRRYRRRERVPRAPCPPAEAARDNLACLARLVSLDEVEQRLLQLLLAINESAALEDLFDELGQVSVPDAARALAMPRICRARA
ncbi:MAG: hypothetical protein HYY06_12720 [Deltaproteobacteria bacterium]|nr:hypothetical protein [Deltaproteobacteria bacterium]